MEYIHGLSFQLTAFLRSVGLGLILGILYDRFRVLRLLFGRLTPLFDTLYFCAAAFLTFCFGLAFCDGMLRLYVYLGCFLGWMIHYLSFGSFISRLQRSAAGKISRLSAGIRKKVHTFLKNIYKMLKNILKKCKDVCYDVCGFVYPYKKDGNKCLIYEKIRKKDKRHCCSLTYYPHCCFLRYHDKRKCSDRQTEEDCG